MPLTLVKRTWAVALRGRAKRRERLRVTEKRRCARQTIADSTKLKSTLVSILLVNRIHRALPWPMEFLQQLLGRRDSARNEFLNRPQETRLVVAGPVMLAALRQP